MESGMLQILTTADHSSTHLSVVVNQQVRELRIVRHYWTHNAKTVPFIRTRDTRWGTRESGEVVIPSNPYP